MRYNGALEAVSDVCRDLQPEAAMRKMTPDAQSVFISGPPCHVPSRGRPDGQHLSHALGLRVRHSPQLNSRSLGHGNTRIYHSCLPPRPPLVVNHRMERIIPPWGHFVCEMSGMTPIDPRIPVKATRPAQGHHALRAQIACHADSIGTDCSYLGLEKRRAEVIKGSVALRNRTGPRQMTTIYYGYYGEARAVIEKHTQEGRMLSRRVDFSVLICSVEVRICSMLLPSGQGGYVNPIASCRFS
jgi:hypothetical protein